MDDLDPLASGRLDREKSHEIPYMKQIYAIIKLWLMKIALKLLHLCEFEQNDARTSQGIHVSLWFALDYLMG